MNERTMNRRTLCKVVVSMGLFTVMNQFEQGAAAASAEIPQAKDLPPTKQPAQCQIGCILRRHDVSDCVTFLKKGEAAEAIVMA